MERRSSQLRDRAEGYLGLGYPEPGEAPERDEDERSGIEITPAGGIVPRIPDVTEMSREELKALPVGGSSPEMRPPGYRGSVREDSVQYNQSPILENKLFNTIDTDTSKYMD